MMAEAVCVLSIEVSDELSDRLSNYLLSIHFMLSSLTAGGGGGKGGEERDIEEAQRGRKEIGIEGVSANE